METETSDPWPEWPELTVTKLDCARRQFEAAITGNFSEGDPVCVWTLAAAAHQIVHGIADKKHGQKSPMIFTDEYMGPTAYAAFKKQFLYVENFFKHAREEPEPDLELTFKPRAVEFYILDGLDLFKTIGGHWSDPMLVLRLWMHASYPGLFPTATDEVFAKDAPVDLRKLSKQEFFTLAMQELASLRRKGFAPGN